MAIPRVRLSRRYATHWWAPELGEKRQQCDLARRKIQRARRRRCRNQSEEEELHSRYREAVISLQHGIREAKSRAGNELIEAIDHDSWGRPYRLILGKLRPRAPPLTESLVPMMLERILSTLFPRDSSELPGSEHLLVDYDPPAPVTQTELKAAVPKMTAKNTPLARTESRVGRWHWHSRCSAGNCSQFSTSP